MFLIAAVLFIFGFVFPPAWLALLGVGIYFFASRRSRRADAIEVRVKRMVNAGQTIAHFPELYFEAARGYAIEKGAKAADDISASATVVVSGRPYNVVFSRGNDGGTGMTVRDQRVLKRELEGRLNRFR